MTAPLPSLALTFLDPVSGLVAGVLAGAAVLSLYFLKLRRRALRVSSTLLWERAVQDLQVNVPFRWLRASWLLLLQLLGVAALAAAIARPAIDSGWTPRGRVIILIDRSASMSALDGERARGPLGPDAAPASRLDEAKRRAAELIRRLNLEAPGAEAMVAAFAADARVGAGLTRSRSELLRAVDAVSPTDQPDNLGAAFELARAFASTAGDMTDPESDAAAEGRPTIVLFTDGGPFVRESSGIEPLALPDAGAPVRVERVGPAPAAEPDTPSPPTPAPPATPDPRATAPSPPGGADNLGIVALSARRDATDPSRARVFFRVQSALHAPVDASLIFSIDAQPARAVAVTIPAAAHGAPSESTESVILDAPDPCVIEARLTRPDALASDNAAWLVLPPPGGPSILLVAPGDNAPSPDGALQHALESLPDARIRAITTAAYNALAPSSDQIAGADLIVFDRVEPRAIPARPSLHVGAGLAPAGVRVRQAIDPDAPPRASRALSWARASPVMRDLSLDSVLFAGEPALELPEGADAVAHADSGPIIATIDARGRRRAFLAFEVGRSTWWLTPGFAIFMANAVEWLSGFGVDVVGQFNRTDEPLVVVPAPGASAVRAEGPASLAVQVMEGLAPGEAISLGLPERVGVYTLTAASPARAAVNLLDPRESALTTASSPFGDAPGAGPGAGARAPEQAGREIWRWFALAAVILLTAEWWLYAWRSRVGRAPAIVRPLGAARDSFERAGR